MLKTTVIAITLEDEGDIVESTSLVQAFLRPALHRLDNEHTTFDAHWVFLSLEDVDADDIVVIDKNRLVGG